MNTMSVGFRYDAGKKVGYDISFPNNFGGEIVLSNVSARDSSRIVKEIRALGHSKEDIEIERIEN